MTEERPIEHAKSWRIDVQGGFLWFVGRARKLFGGPRQTDELRTGAAPWRG